MSTKIYSYGANAPIEGLESVRHQMRLAHRYRNLLTSLEIKKRRRVEQAVRLVAPGLPEIEARIAVLEVQLEGLTKGLRARRAEARKRVVDGVASAAIKAAKADLKALRASRKSIRRATFGVRKPESEWADDEVPEWEIPPSAAWTLEQDRINGWLYPRKRHLRAAAVACGLFWGTYLVVEASCKKAHKGAPPKFRRWDGHGKVAVQIQKGMSVMSLAGDDTRLRLRRGDEVVPRSRRLVADRERCATGGAPCHRHVRGRRAGGRCPGDESDIDRGVGGTVDRRLGDAVVSLRIGSDGRKPIFARVPIRFHRPLPPSASVLWAWLTVTRLGSHESWRMQFVLSDVPAQADRAVTGAVGIDVGWRMIGQAPREISTGDAGRFDQKRGAEPPERRLRVASWLGTDGASGELSLSAGWLDQMRKVEDIRSIRDQGFDAAKARLVSFLASGMSPAWLQAATLKLALWKSAGRLAGLAVLWRRHPGDGAEFDALEAWRKRDLHLLDYEANLRDQIQGSRLDHYRKFAAAMRRRYGSIYVEKLDLRDFHAIPEAEEAPVDGALKEHVRDAALSILLGCLKESGSITVKAAWTTKTCGLCGHDNEWEDQSPLVLTCEGCGAAWDQDVNARGNILRSGLASTRVVAPGA
jgi:hypothetical protein